MLRILRILVGAVIIGSIISACSTTHRATQSKRTAIEQLLLSEAVTRSLPNDPDEMLPIPPGSKVFIEISGISGDEKFVREVMAGWLGQYGYLVQNEVSKATYRINAVLASLGTESGHVLVGIPEVEGSYLSIGELAFYKVQHQTGYANLFLDIFELSSGRHIHRTSKFLGETFYNYYTVLLLIDFYRTNLIKAPRLVSFQNELMN
ncbi:MAG: hypothetical protein Q8K07_18160 [Methylicorpusculum sp.]|uniref:hypothetical protein n=1 Tax=Methylicorpusculum sp. TaxID=2713644 RepID=UPI00272FDADE|nr:hypothetical protein [Methylicorpusculum sp.]MDP2203946.1 hypothetical protein [Methylicorpusculum sp.]